MKKVRGYISIALMVMICFFMMPARIEAKTTGKASIKLNKSKATIYISGNKTVQLKATVSGKSKKVTWKSSNKEIAVVDAKGKVTAKKAGSATITAAANGKTAKCKITVKNNTPSQASKAIKAYKKLLTQKTITIEAEKASASDFDFALVYIDGDSVPELILKEDDNLYLIYIYKDGKAKRILTCGDWFADFSYYKKTGIFRVWQGCTADDDTSYYRLSKGKLSELYSSEWMLEESTKYYRGGKRISKAAFHSGVKNLVGAKKKTKLTFRKNTSANRSKYLK